MKCVRYLYEPHISTRGAIAEILAGMMADNGFYLNPSRGALNLMDLSCKCVKMKRSTWLACLPWIDLLAHLRSTNSRFLAIMYA
jgi:hypothetical protein